MREVFDGGAQAVYHLRQASTVGKSSLLPPEVPNCDFQNNGKKRAFLFRDARETVAPIRIASGLLLYG